MKANEFVKKFGWGRAKREVALIGTIAMMCCDKKFNDDLKRLVESHELVEAHGGIDEAKDMVKCMQANLSNGVYFKCVEENAKLKIERLKQAILDVESCK